MNKILQTKLARVDPHLELNHYKKKLSTVHDVIALTACIDRECRNGVSHHLVHTFSFNF